MTTPGDQRGPTRPDARRRGTTGPVRRSRRAGAVLAAALVLGACSSGAGGGQAAFDMDPVGVGEEVHYAPAPPPGDPTCPGEGEGCDDVVVASCQDGSSWYVCRLAADGSGAQASLLAGSAPPWVSPDGRHLIIWSPERPASVTTAIGSVRTPFLPSTVRWLDDERLIAWADDHFEVLDLDGNVVERLDGFPVADAGAEPGPAVWLSPDGEALVASSWAGSPASHRLWLYRFATGAWSEVDDGPGWLQVGAFEVGWTADSHRLVVTVQQTRGDELDAGERRLTSEVREIDLDDGGRRRVVARFGHIGALAGVLSPDGRLLAVRSETSTVFVELATARISNRVVTGGSSRYPSLVWAPGSDRVALEIGGRIAVIGVSVADRLAATDPAVISGDDYDDFIEPHWPGRPPG